LGIETIDDLYMPETLEICSFANITKEYLEILLFPAVLHNYLKTVLFFSFCQSNLLKSSFSKPQKK